MKSYICAVGTANPEHKIPQMQIAGFMADALQFNDADRRKLAALYRVSGIDTRYTVLEDYAKQNGTYDFFPNEVGLEPFPSVALRMQAYRKHALPLSVKAVQDCLTQAPELDLQKVTHLITVSCTGMYAPGLDIELVEALELRTSVERTSVNFMGCYAAFNALKLANTICKAHPEANVLVVCTELCTLHFQKSPETDHLVSNALFGDGAAAVWLSGSPQTSVALEMEAFHCDLAPSGKNDMAWHIGNTGFEMTLSSYVPDLIKQGIKLLTENLLRHLQLTLAEIQWYAIHPGGRRILEAIEQELGMVKEQNRFAYSVLRQFGNMSSVTVLFVLRELMKELAPENHDERVLSFAFGPGLTLESMLLKVHHVCKKRSAELELMDDLLLAEGSLRRNLDELEIINQRLGGYKVVTNALEILLPELQKLNRKVTIADLGCGGGDTLREMASWCHEKKLPVALKGIDANNFMLQYATLKCVTYPEITFQQQNIFSEAFKLQRYDIIVCSLFCHHFSDADLVTFFQQFTKQARTAVIINDLHRHPVAYYSIKVLTHLFSGSYLVKNDAPLSVLRAFRKKELQILLQAAGIKNYLLRWKWAFRWQLVLYPN